MKKQWNQCFKQTLAREQGFSLIELMIVIGIMGLLIGMLGPKLIEKFDGAKVDTTRIQMKQIATTLKNYRLDCGQYPTTDQGLDALVTKPSSGPDCKNYSPSAYMQKIPKDAFDMDFLYESDGNAFKITSYGSDKKPGGSGYAADIIVTDTD